MIKFTRKDLEILKLPLAIPLLDNLNSSFELGKINTFNRIAFLMANLMHESGDFKYLKEIHDGSNYEMRASLGNVQKGDGKKYLGRSAVMTTGRANYRSLTRWANAKGIMENFETNPELLETPKFAILPAIQFWEMNKLEKWADEGNFKAVCSIINTGKPNSAKINGYEDRLKKLDRVVLWLQTVLK